MCRISVPQMVLRGRGVPGWLGWAGQLGSEHQWLKVVKTRLGSWAQGASRAPPTLEPKSGLLMKRIECFGMYGISVTERSQRTRMAWLGWTAGLWAPRGRICNNSTWQLATRCLKSPTHSRAEIGPPDEENRVFWNVRNFRSPNCPERSWHLTGQ